MSIQSLLDADPGLQPFRHEILRRERYMQVQQRALLGRQRVEEFALGFHYFGLQRTDTGWTFREWAPHATRVVLVGDFSDWQEREEFTLTPTSSGEWQGHFPAEALRHGQRYKLRVYWPGGSGWRLPSYATRVVQADDSVEFMAEIWQPEKPFQWQHPTPPAPATPLIYEAHIGMSSEAETVASFDYFRTKILPRIKQAGYNTVQLMAIAEHPYYGSFGYHVSNFFAVSSRFGTPDDFKRLIDTAHGMGLRVIIDLVHAHAAKNEAEGLAKFDGTVGQYFQRGLHPAWDSRLFNYRSPQVLHFLLSNCRWWLDEYHVDGFRFDGVTSMLYKHHGLGKDFITYQDYYTDDINLDALVYLRLANALIHRVRPDAVTIAEEMSGLPGLCAPIDGGGLGFDYRLHMGTPDLWIKTLKEQRDEAWDLGHIVHTIQSHRPEERVITYTESHDQALVGDKTLAFRLIGRAMYDHMDKADIHPKVERGVALHKLIRLLTAALHGGGWLSFMGNEFGHPEWIDFPRESNGWSYKHARRQWSLRDNGFLQYQWLGEFDAALMDILPHITAPMSHLQTHQTDQTVTCMRGDYLFIFNFSPTNSYANFAVPATAGSYSVVWSTDDAVFGGQGRVDASVRHFTSEEEGSSRLRVYIPARCGMVLRRVD
ncbi:MAG: alpha-amylase family glycosyl hydrolase [Candidatus Saccharibacteria bacterium]|nr:alpha-amylase family glycosyl hydrolase [Candidatus Saccharibacteria bacterium]